MRGFNTIYIAVSFIFLSHVVPILSLAQSNDLKISKEVGNIVEEIKIVDKSLNLTQEHIGNISSEIINGKIEISNSSIDKIPKLLFSLSQNLTSIDNKITMLNNRNEISKHPAWGIVFSLFGVIIGSVMGHCFTVKIAKTKNRQLSIGYIGEFKRSLQSFYRSILEIDKYVDELKDIFDNQHFYLRSDSLLSELRVRIQRVKTRLIEYKEENRNDIRNSIFALDKSINLFEKRFIDELLDLFEKLQGSVYQYIYDMDEKSIASYHELNNVYEQLIRNEIGHISLDSINELTLNFMKSIKPYKKPYFKKFNGKKE